MSKLDTQAAPPRSIARATAIGAAPSNGWPTRHDAGTRRAFARGTCPGAIVSQTTTADDEDRPSAADRTPLAAVMTRNVVSVSPDLPVSALLRVFTERDLRAVPVIAGDGRVVGMVSRGDLVGGADDRRGQRVADVMMCFAFSLPATASIARAAALMAYEGVHRIPVVTADGRLVGIVSSLDIVRWMAREEGYRLAGPRARLPYRAADRR